MSVIAGALRLSRNTDVLPQVSTEIRRHLSRGPDAIVEFTGPAYYLAKIDVGAFDAPAAHRDAEGNVSLMAGEPLLRERSPGAYTNRQTDLIRLHSEWTRGDWSGLQDCAGAFCAVNYIRETSRIALIADKLGLRPIYYRATPEVFIFATALRILEQIRTVRLDLDLRGVTEVAVFGFPPG
jgi:asparagine synthase (glutamine-hydrolysing)